MRIGFVVIVLLLSGCAVDSKGILLAVEPATPLDQRDLRSHCDLGDPAACALAQNDELNLPPPTIPIVQGIAPADRAVFAALVPQGSQYSWFLYDRGRSQLWKLPTARIQTRSASAWAVQRVEVRGLVPDQEYDLLASDQTGKLLEDRSFRTLSAEVDSLRIALVSGLKNQSRPAADHMMAEVAKRRPALILFTGSNLEALLPKSLTSAKTAATLDFFYDRHAQLRSLEAFARNRHLTPIGAVWSEFEFGQRKGDRTFAYRDQAREALEMFFPKWADEERVINGPGISLSFPLADHRFILLDNRSFRAPDPVAPEPFCELRGKKRVCTQDPAPPAAPGARFGHLQIDWTTRQREKSQQDVVLFSSDPWFGPYTADWFERATRPLPELGAIKDGGFAILGTQNSRLIPQEIIPQK